MFLSIFMVLLHTCVTNAVVVTTKYGRIRGQTLELHTGQRINSFLGIPFAKPPIGNLRWQRPQEPDSWTDELVANKYGSMCKQSVPLISLSHPDYDNYSEDCLHLNIYSPNNTATPGPYSVMIFIHGGAFAASGTIQYPGHFLAAQDVIVVMINYRLGALGFMTTGDNALTPNVGMLDQVQAMKFVKENIAAFGGDPNKVTLFGQSAGGASVGLHLVSPLSKGLFTQANTMSGTGISSFACSNRQMKPENLTFSVAEKVNCSRSSTVEMVECLRNIEADTLLDTDPDLVYGGAEMFNPVVDNFTVNSFLPDEPWNIRQQGKHAKVPLMSGITSEEGSLFVPLAAEDGGLNQSNYVHELREMINTVYSGETPYRREQMYQAVHFQYTNWPHVDDVEGNRQSFVKLYTDWLFGAKLDTQLKHHSKESPTYQYIFGYRSANLTEEIPEWMGVIHGGDILYVFGYAFFEDNPAVQNETGIELDIPHNPEAREFSAYTMNLYANFAKTSNPTPQPVHAPGTNPPTIWPQFDNNNLRYLTIKSKIETKDHYRQQQHAFWNHYFQWLLKH